MQKQEGAIEEEIFENERYLPIRGWASRGGLLPTERRRYSTRDGSQSFNDFPTLHLPTGEMLQRSATLAARLGTLRKSHICAKILHHNKTFAELLAGRQGCIRSVRSITLDIYQCVPKSICGTL